MIIDLHSHIVPGVDDGSQSIEESIGILKLMKRQGVDIVFATPHFYAKICNLEEHTAAVEESFAKLKEAVSEFDLPQMHLGYEVRYFAGMSDGEGLDRLTLGNTDYILVELPYADISRRMVDDVIQIGYNTRFKPIFAHIDRYITYKNFGYLKAAIAESGTLAQINADSLAGGFSFRRKEIFSLIENGYATFIGSDAHSVKERPPRIGEAIENMNKKLGTHRTEAFFKNIERLLGFATDTVDGIYGLSNGGLL